jgi:hypothetical protein
LRYCFFVYRHHDPDSCPFVQKRIKAGSAPDAEIFSKLRRRGTVHCRWRGAGFGTDIGGAAGAAIPKKLWTYWNHPQPDSFVRECIQSWHLQCPDYEVCLVHPGNLAQYVAQGALPARFHELHPTKQSDWLRLYLVALHGASGWMPAPC